MLILKSNLNHCILSESRLLLNTEITMLNNIGSGLVTGKHITHLHFGKSFVGKVLLSGAN